MDQYHDTCHTELVKIARDYNLPEYVLDQDIQTDSLRKLASCDFAFPEARYFPIHTKEDTLLSAAFFLTKKAEFGKYQNSIYDRLKSACISYNIVDDFNNLDTFEKKANTKEYALPELKKFPINNMKEVEKAASWLRKQKEVFPQDVYLTVKERIEKKASALKDCTVHYGVPKVLDLEKAASYMLHRAKKTEDSVIKIAMLKITKAMLLTKEDRSRDPEGIQKIAEFIDRFDYLTGVNRRGSYLKGEDAITSSALFEKQASASLTIEGRTYTGAELEKVSVSKLREGLGASFVDAISASDGGLDLEKFAEIADTLPLPDKKILAMYLS
jgi:hypothetical protein